MSKRDDADLGEAIAGVALGIIGGIALGALLDYLLGRKCPRCNRVLTKEMIQCPNCGCFVERWV